MIDLKEDINPNFLFFNVYKNCLLKNINFCLDKKIF